MNIMQTLMTEMNRRMFPGGKTEERADVIVLRQQLSRRYTGREISTLLRYVLSNMLLFERKSPEDIIKSACERNNNTFTREDIETVVSYAKRKACKGNTRPPGGKRT